MAHPRRARGHAWLSSRAEVDRASYFRNALGWHPGSGALERESDSNDAHHLQGSLSAWTTPCSLHAISLDQQGRLCVSPILADEETGPPERGRRCAPGHQVNGSVCGGDSGIPEMPGQRLRAESPLLRTPVSLPGLPAGYRSCRLRPGHSGHSHSAPAAAPGQPSQHPGGLSPAPGRLPGTLQKARRPGGLQRDRDFTLKPPPWGTPSAPSTLPGHSLTLAPGLSTTLVTKEEPPHFTDAKPEAQRPKVPHTGSQPSMWGWQELRPSRATTSNSQIWGDSKTASSQQRHLPRGSERAPQRIAPRFDN